jgi:hypothetical protein
MDFELLPLALRTMALRRFVLSFIRIHYTNGALLQDLIILFYCLNVYFAINLKSFIAAY